MRFDLSTSVDVALPTCRRDGCERSGVWNVWSLTTQLGFRRKKIIGGNSMVPGEEDKHPSTDMPKMVWVLPILCIVAIGLAVTAYLVLVVWK